MADQKPDEQQWEVLGSRSLLNTSRYKVIEEVVDAALVYAVLFYAARQNRRK